MSLAFIFTDLDGTLLEPDGSVSDEVRRALADLASLGVPVCPVSSKTPAELSELSEQLHLPWPGGFENGAGIRLADGTLRLSSAAVPVEALREILAVLRQSTSAPVRSMEEAGDAELSRLTGLSGDAVGRARQRQASLPLVVDPIWDEKLRALLPASPAARLVRGNRFLHLQGRHDKADVVPALAAVVGARAGLTIACGDAPNDSDLLAQADIAVIVPGARGPHPDLVRRFPNVRIAPLPHGRGWAAVMHDMLSAQPGSTGAGAWPARTPVGEGDAPR